MALFKARTERRGFIVKVHEFSLLSAPQRERGVGLTVRLYKRSWFGIPRVVFVKEYCALYDQHNPNVCELVDYSIADYERLLMSSERAAAAFDKLRKGGSDSI